jgi:biopolymer transport protein ExbD
MTPMIDVIFLLLTFFVLTAKFRTPEQFLPIHLATADAAVEHFGPIEPLIISISGAEGGCLVEIGGLASVQVESERYADGFLDFAGQAAGISDITFQMTGQGDDLAGE